MSKRWTQEELDKFFEGFEESLMPPKTAYEKAVEHNRRARQLLAEDRWKQRQLELPAERRQAAIDAVWEWTLEARRELEEEEAQSFHRGPGDPDYHR
jgi:hypothetical protein